MKAPDWISLYEKEKSIVFEEYEEFLILLSQSGKTAQLFCRECYESVKNTLCVTPQSSQEEKSASLGQSILELLSVHYGVQVISIYFWLDFREKSLLTLSCAILPMFNVYPQNWAWTLVLLGIKERNIQWVQRNLWCWPLISTYIILYYIFFM